MVNALPDDDEEERGSVFLFLGGAYGWGVQVGEADASMELQGGPGEQLGAAMAGGADLDGDGRDDWLTTGVDPDAVYLLTDTPAHVGATVSTAEATARVDGRLATSISIGDFDGDDALDVAFAAAGGYDEEVYMIANTLLPRAGAATLSDVAVGFASTNGMVDMGGDATGDGLYDLLVADWWSGSAWLIAGR